MSQRHARTHLTNGTLGCIMRDMGSRIAEMGSSTGMLCLFLALTLCRGPRQTSHQDSEGTDVATRSPKIGPGEKTGM